jgi:hypothetical protein
MTNPILLIRIVASQKITALLDISQSVGISAVAAGNAAVARAYIEGFN